MLSIVVIVSFFMLNQLDYMNVSLVVLSENGKSQSQRWFPDGSKADRCF